MKKIFSVLSMAILAMVAQTDGAGVPEHFIGTFEIDPEATIQNWKEERPFGERTDWVIRGIGPILGGYFIELTDSHLRTWSRESEGVGVKREYEIVEKDEGMIYIKRYNETCQRYDFSRLKATEDGFWEYSDALFVGYRAKFRRIEPDS